MPTRAHPDLSPRDALIVTAPGLEAVTRRELSALGITVTGEESGVLEAALASRDVMRANLHLRTASRVAVRLAEFRALTFADIERHAKRVPWETVVTAGQRVRFRVTCRKSRLYHSGAVAQRLAEALDGRVPGVVIARKATDDETEGGDEQLFIVRLFRDQLVLSADTSGELLHRRGYRQAIAKAPLRETLAAAMLLGANWDGTSPLVDPLCGSGTLAIEAAMIARRFAPGRARRFAFENWPTFDAGVWTTVRAAAKDEERTATVEIRASDRDAGAVAAAIANAARAGVNDSVDVRHHALSALDVPISPGLVVVNPPYGIRVGEKAPLRNLFAQLGHVLRERAGGWRLGMLSADRELERQVQLPFKIVWTSSNGGIPVRYVVAEVPLDGH